MYAPTIKDRLDLTQTQVATVGSAVNLGGYFAIVSGAIYDSLKDYHKLGPRWVGQIPTGDVGSRVLPRVVPVVLASSGLLAVISKCHMKPLTPSSGCDHVWFSSPPNPPGCQNHSAQHVLHVTTGTSILF